MTDSNLTQAKNHAVQKYDFIDALRGYAVLLVITCHAGAAFVNLPYPVKKITNVGWHGVKLFFLVSCVTLMISWRSDERKSIANQWSFWRRRFFRIVPMYYLAALFYFIVEPPASGFDFWQLISSFTFINAWSPDWTPTVPGKWMVVPGGWSIGVEFTFYFLFPIVVAKIRSVRAGALFLIFAIGFACVANTLARPYFLSTFGQTATDNFLYFWFPNQMPVFALGTLLFFAIDVTRKNPPTFLTRYALIIVGGSAAGFTLLAESAVPLADYFKATPAGLFPMLLAETIFLWIAALAFSANENMIVINKPIRALGKVSFSAYIFHLFVIHTLSYATIFGVRTSVGYGAIGAFALFWCLTVAITYFLSHFTFGWIEQPMINFGKNTQKRVLLLSP
jgi:peptidoglycan/LPS O-acetylase OafA/YrhL